MLLLFYALTSTCWYSDIWSCLCLLVFLLSFKPRHNYWLILKWCEVHVSVLSGAYGGISITVFASLNGECCLLCICCCSCGLPLWKEIPVLHSPATSLTPDLQTEQLWSELFPWADLTENYCWIELTQPLIDCSVGRSHTWEAYVSGKCWVSSAPLGSGVQLHWLGWNVFLNFWQVISVTIIVVHLPIWLFDCLAQLLNPALAVKLSLIHSFKILGSKS